MVERTNSWLKQYKRLSVRYECKIENFTAFLWLACMHLYLGHF
jgi:transposase